VPLLSLSLSLSPSSIALACKLHAGFAMKLVSLAWLVTRTRTRSSEIASEQKRTCANENGHNGAENRPVSSPCALLWCATYAVYKVFVFLTFL
jgi:hypothetical protein